MTTNKNQKLLDDKLNQESSWDGLEDIIPEGYKYRVRQYLEEAEQRIHELAEDDPTLKNRVEKRIQRFNNGSDHKNKSLYVRNADRKRLILQCFSIGMKGKQIADRLGVNWWVINNDINYMKKKFGCKTTYELLARSIRSGFIQ